MAWRKNIDPLIKNHLEAQIRESYRHRRDYSKSKTPSKAQLWCAIASLSKQIFDLNLKVKFLEKALQETLSKKKKDNDLIKNLQKF